MPDKDPQRLHHDLTTLLCNADARRVLTLDALQQRIDTARRFVGVRALRHAIADLRGELSHSGTERRARKIVAAVLAKYGLTLHHQPYPVDLNGRRIGEADLAVTALRLDIEIDGPHHLFAAQREKDQLRDRWMRRAGWEVERFTTKLIDLSPKTFAARVDECVRFRLGK